IRVVILPICGSVGGISFQRYFQTYLKILYTSSAEIERMLAMSHLLISFLLTLAFLRLLYSFVHITMTSARTESTSIAIVLDAPMRDIIRILRLMKYLFRAFLSIV